MEIVEQSLPFAYSVWVVLRFRTRCSQGLWFQALNCLSFKQEILLIHLKAVFCPQGEQDLESICAVRTQSSRYKFSGIFRIESEQTSTRSSGTLVVLRIMSSYIYTRTHF